MNQGNLEPTSPDDFDSDIDASYGTRIDDLDQPLILYKNRSGSLKALHSRVKIVALLLVYPTYLFLSENPERWWMVVCYFLYLGFLYLAQRRSYLLAVRPVMEMNSEGLVLHAQYVNLSIPWNEIKEVRAHRFVVWHIGIVPINTAKTVSHASFGTKCYIWSNIFLIGFCRLFGIFVAPIELLASEFPISAEALAELINLRRSHALEQTQQNNLKILPPQ